MRVLKFFFNTLVYVLIVVSIVWGLPSFLSWKLGTEYPIAAITSGSMWPALKEKDLVFIEAVEAEDLAVGDIVVWQNARGFTIHRIVKLDEDTLVTKGDANFKKDKPISYTDIVGRTVQFRGKSARIPYLGFISVLGGALGEKIANNEGE